MNKWKKLLAFLAKKGYKNDKPDAESVKKFLAEHPEIEVLDEDTSDPIDVDAIHKAASKKSTVTIGGENDPGDTDSGQQEDKDLAEFRAFQKQRAESARGSHRDKVGLDTEESTSRKHNPAAWKRAQDKKAYDFRAKAGLTKFTDADTAETTAALCRLAICGSLDYVQKKMDLDIVTKAQVEFTNTAGGFLVPPEFVAQMIYLTEPFGVARKLANVRRMSRDVQQFPRKTGISTMSFISETGTLSESNAAYDQVSLTAKKAGCIITASNELLEDAAVNVADDIASGVREAYDNKVDDCYFIGDGTATYGGIQGLISALPASAYMNATGAWSAFVLGDFHLAMGRVENVNWSRCAFACSRQFFNQVMQRLDKATSQFKGLVGPGIGGADASFLGVPVYFSQRMATATGGAGTKSVYFGDFLGATMIGERRDLSIAASEHSAFTSDSIVWRATTRFDVNVHGDGRATTYGPVVCLLTA